MAKIAKPKAILLDVEGTICDKKFFGKTLYPFVKDNVNRFLVETYEDRETKSLIGRLRDQQRKNSKLRSAPAVVEGNKDMVCRSASQCFEWLLTRKKNISEVKQLFLLCWLWGYSKAMITSEVYQDVPKALHIWKNNLGLKLYTFSSGLVAAQKLMLCQTNRGNVYCLIDGFFDNSIGDKKSSKSYESIQKSIGVDVKDILFVSDSSREGNAAQSAGFKVVLVKRPGTNTSNPGAFQTITSFTDIKF